MDIFQCLWNWLSKHEWLAVWIEGLALVDIFVWDRVDARDSHKVTLAQIAIAREEAQAAKLTAESIKNSEGAWLTASLLWNSGQGRILQSGDEKANNLVTQASFILKIRNDGRTPAWVSDIVSMMDIPGRKTSQINQLGTIYIEAFGAGAEQEIPLSVQCPGAPKREKDEQLTVRISVNYQDIFENRALELMFSLNPFTYRIHRFGTSLIPRVAQTLVREDEAAEREGN